MSVEAFPYKVDRRYLPLLVPFGMRPSRDRVTVSSDVFVAMFGFVRLETPRSNIASAHITYGYRWWTAIGARLSFADDGITFGTNRDAGVCVHFRVKVPSRLRRGGHSALTVTVGELDRLVELLNSAGA